MTREERERQRTRQQAPYDNGEDQPPTRIHITVTHIQPAGEARDVPLTVIAESLMACLNCGRVMRRGGQCDSCGAWCR